MCSLSNYAPDNKGRRLTKMRSGYNASTNRTQYVGITVPGDTNAGNQQRNNGKIKTEKLEK